MTTGLDARLLQAHACRDHPALVHLYREAAEGAAGTGDANAAGFYLTHAYIYALELGHVDAPMLHARLVADGREA